MNGENGPDVLITGSGYANLYLNDGLGGFTLQETTFAGVSRSSIAFADVNGDTYQDVLITGSGHANLYLNDGSGGFTLKAATPFAGVDRSSIAFADVDGEKGPDVLITGNTGSERIAKLYLNDGSSNFTEKAETPFTGVEFSSIAFADVNGDTYQDVLITGINGSERISNLYLNDGSGSFTEKVNTPFARVSEGSIAFADVDGENGPDVLITGWDNDVSKRIANLYLNDGLGGFTLKAATPFMGVNNSSIAFADVDRDGDQDVLITGQINDEREEISKLYLNDRVPVFTSGSSKSVPENTTAVLDVSVDDDSDSETFSYSVSGGADEDSFSIGDTGALTFQTAPDFEAMGSAAGNNIYEVEVTVSDGVNEGVSQTITVTVTDVNEAPTEIELNNKSINENVTANTVVGTFTTTDPDTGDSFIYRLAAGPGDTDNGAFTIDGDRLQINSSPDFETK
ncbi:MAG: VCBS repeat-containing protein, partial [Ekhidna sp.]|nr:VCBS repeat-containing protein [Ekhidna sp.]